MLSQNIPTKLKIEESEEKINTAPSSDNSIQISVDTAELEKIFGIDFSIKNLEKAKHCPQFSKVLMAQILLAAMAIPAGYFYKKYSEMCIQNEFCTRPLFFLSKDNQQIVLELSGGAGFSGSATKLAIEAAPALKKTYDEQKSKSAKASFIVYCSVSSLVAVGQMILGVMGSLKEGDSLTNSNTLLALILPSLAIIPTALNNASFTYPILISNLRKKIANAFLSDPITQEEFYAKASREHYLKEYDAFKNNLITRQNYILENLETVMQMQVTQNSLEFFMNLDLTNYTAQNKNLYRKAGLTLGLVTGGTFSAFFTWNTFIQLEKFFPTFTSGLLTGVLAYLSLPANFRLTMDYYVDLISGNTLIEQFYPRKTLAAKAIMTATQIPSHAAVISLMLGVSAPTWLLILGWMGITAFHTKGLNDLMLGLSSSILMKDPKKKWMLDLDGKINSMKKITYEKFVTEIISKPETRTILNVTAFDPKKPISTVKSAPQSYWSKVPSLSSAWCSLTNAFSCCRRKSMNAQKDYRSLVKGK